MNASDVTEEDLLKCGRNFCPRGAEDGNGTSAGLEPPSQDLVRALSFDRRRKPEYPAKTTA